MITITENSRPNLALLPANTTTVTLHAVTEANQTPNTVTIVDPAAVSIKKSCASGVTGKASFTVNNDSEQAQFSIDVACGATTALPLPQGWDASEDLLIHESTTPTNGVAANDVTVRIPESNGSAQVAEFVNPAAVATASPTPTVVPQLAQTGDRGGTPLMLFLGVAAGSALLILGGLTVWRRRQA
jgi:LPXTG-motif cell wall-anchored protein